MQEGNIGSTLVITARYLKEKNGEKHYRDKKEKTVKFNYDEQEYRVRRSSKRRE